jgi:small nuclear ribonucleoprotein (snRNP)-like protein
VRLVLKDRKEISGVMRGCDEGLMIVLDEAVEDGRPLGRILVNSDDL